MKKLWRLVVISASLLACGTMPAAAQRAGTRIDRSGRGMRKHVVARQRPKASKIDVTADEGGVVFIGDMDRAE